MDEKNLTGGVFKAIGLRMKCEGSRSSLTGRVQVLTGGQWQLALSPLQPKLQVIPGDCAIVTSQQESTLICKDGRGRELGHDEVVSLSKQAGQAFDCDRH
jgi:hypothetical protein